MTITKSTSDVRPQNKIERISKGKYSCRICDNIVESDNSFSFDSYRNSFCAATYSELLINIIHTRYSYDDETNLINDFLAEGANEKYTKYRSFVAWAKEMAKSLAEEGV